MKENVSGCFFLNTVYNVLLDKRIQKIIQAVLSQGTARCHCKLLCRFVFHWYF